MSKRDMLRIILLVAILITAIGAKAQDIPLTHRANDYFGALNMSFEQKIRAKETLSQWNSDTLEFNNRHRLDEKLGCYSKNPGEVIIILQIEKNGEVSEVYTSIDNEKSRCFVKSYKGVFFPKPPLAPAYVLQRML